MVNQSIHSMLSPGWSIKPPDEGYVYDCPWCLGRVGKIDVGNHLYLSYRRSTFICHRCRVGGDFKRLAKLLKIRFVTSTPLSEWEKEVNKFYQGENDENVDVIPGPIELPTTFERVRPGRVGYPYLKERGLSDEDIDYYKFFSDMRAARVIAPTYMDGELVYWVSRLVVNSGYLSKSPKYKNCPVPRSHVLFNYDKARFNDHIFITEGIFSAIAAGKNAVATFGKYISNGQYRLLCGMKNVKKFYFALDGDAIDGSLRSARILSDMGKSTYVVLFDPDQDPDDFVRSNPDVDLRDLAVRYSRDSEIEVLANTI